MKQFLGPGGEKEAKVKVREANRESLKRVELRGETGGQWTCTGDLRYDDSRGASVSRTGGGSTPWCVGDPILHVASG